MPLPQFIFIFCGALCSSIYVQRTLICFTVPILQLLTFITVCLCRSINGTTYHFYSYSHKIKIASYCKYFVHEWIRYHITSPLFIFKLIHISTFELFHPPDNCPHRGLFFSQWQYRSGSLCGGSLKPQTAHNEAKNYLSCHLTSLASSLEMPLLLRQLLHLFCLGVCV